MLPTRLLTSLWLLLLVTGCSTNLLKQLEKNPAYETNVISGEFFLHHTVRNQYKGHSLNIYIEGDGRPFWTRSQPALDPTPRKLTMLSLMKMDQNPAVYIGRPCYFHLQDKACEPIWWTFKRYSEEVVDSMNAAIDHFAGEYTSIRLMGFSGGGTLATLIAARRNDVDGLVTLAANLDVEAWADWHQYSPLQGSLNPAEIPALHSSIRQRHYVGAEDKHVPAQLNREWLSERWHTTLTILPDVDHHCCWESIWPQILQLLQPSLKNQTESSDL